MNSLQNLKDECSYNKTDFDKMLGKLLTYNGGSSLTESKQMCHFLCE